MVNGSNDNPRQANETISDAMSTTLLALANNLTLQNSIAGLSTYDGSNVPLKDFLQDVRNGDESVSVAQKPSYLRAVLGKLRGPAKDCTYGQTFNNLEGLCTHLKQRFAPGKDFAYYNNRLHSLRMRQGDSIGTYKDQINILLNCARTALKDEKGNAFEENMLTPLTGASVDIFIRGLPGTLSQLVDLSRPQTLEEAYKEAVRLEARMDARIIPDGRLRGGNKEAQRPTEKGAYVGCVQEAEETADWTNWEEPNEIPENQEVWPDYAVPVAAENIGYEVFYQQGNTYQNPPKFTPPQMSMMAPNQRMPYGPPMNFHGPGYQIFGNPVPGGPHPMYRPYMVPRPRTWDPDQVPPTFRPPGNNQLRFNAPPPGLRPNYPGAYPQPPASQRMPQLRLSAPVQCQPIAENFTPQPTLVPESQGQHLNCQQARPATSEASQNPMMTQTGHPSMMYPPAQMLAIRAEGTPRSTSRTAKTLQTLE